MNLGNKWALFEITDGTDENTVDLISADSSISVVDWQPSMPVAKEGGIYSNSLFEDGRRLVHRTVENVFEEVTISVNNVDENYIIDDMIKLRQLFQSAVSYWTSEWANRPIYIRARGHKETNDRFATIVNWSASNTSASFFQNPTKIFGRVSKPNITIVIERTQFQDAAPNYDIQREIYIVKEDSVSGDFSGTYDNAADKIVPISRMGVVSNYHVGGFIIDHVYYSSSSNSVWSSNIALTSNTPIFNSPIATGDAIYFAGKLDGVNARIYNFVFDLDPDRLLVGSNITWEYWSGSVWTAMDNDPDFFADNTEGFTVGGMNSIVRTAGSTAPLGNLTAIFGGSAPNVSAYWVRARVVSPGSVTSPVPQIKDATIFTATQNFLSLAKDQFNCDISPLARFDVDVQYREPAWLSQADTFPSVKQLLFSTRSISRGADFTPNIGFSNTGNSSFVTVTDNSSSNSNFQTDVETPFGKSIIVTSLTAEGVVTKIADIDISTISDQYIGAYRVFVRFLLSDPSIDNAVKLILNFKNTDRTLETILNMEGYWVGQPPGTAFVADFGYLNFSSQYVFGDDVADLQIEVSYEVLDSTNTSGDDFTLFDLMLMPVDEWTGKYSIEESQINSLMFRVDGSRSPKHRIISSLLDNYDDQNFIRHTRKDQGISPRFQIYADQRLYVMAFEQIPTLANGFTLANFRIVLGVDVYTVNRFHAQRGNY